MARKSDSQPSKDYKPSGKPASTQGPAAHTKEWYENVQAAAKGEPEPHGGPIITDHTR